jgi:hypothetical protein
MGPLPNLRIAMRMWWLIRYQAVALRAEVVIIEFTAGNEFRCI